ncbi:MAG: hypothetical protein ACI4ES_14485 [Roseburia sp.]
MSLNGINNAAAYTAATTNTKTTVSSTSNKEESTTKTNNTSSNGVIYEKGSDTTVTKKDNTAIVEMLKADLEARTQQLTNIVQQMLGKQGNTLAKADDMWRFLASGDFTVTPEIKAQAQADIAEDGYWGVEQTSDRILDFAKALSGGNTDYADELLAAFKKGFEQATGTWGKKLPEISQKTYDAVVEKFEKWKNGTEEINE